MNWRDPKHPQAGGAEAYLFEQARRWVRLGHRVEWLTANFPGGAARDCIDGISIRRTGSASTVYALLPLVYLRECRGRFDVIVDSSNGIPFFSPLFAHVPKLCVMYHVHREVFRKHLPAALAYPLMWCEEKLVPWLYRKAKFVTISEDTRDEMIRLHIGRPPIALVRCGVDDALLPGPKAEVPTVAYLGRLKAYKRVDALIDAFARVRARVPSAVLRLAGSGDARPQLEEQVRRLQLQDAVVFEGFVDESRKRELLQQAWVSVAPSETEGWGITVIESNACGTPAIAYSVPGLREAVVDGVTGVLVPDGDDLAPAIESVLTDAALRRRLQAGALERAREFSWDRSATAMLEEMSSMIPARDGRLRVAVLINTYEDRAESGGFIHLFQSAKRWQNVSLGVFGPRSAAARVARELPAAEFFAIPSAGESIGNRAIDYALRTISGGATLPGRLRRYDAIYVLSQSLPDIVPAVLANSKRTVAQVFHLQPLPWRRPGSFLNNVFAYLSETIGVWLVRAFVSNVVVLTSEIEPALRVSKRTRVTRVGSGTWTIPIEGNELDPASRSGVAYLGRLHPAKGLDDILDAWAIVAKRFPNEVLTLVGTGDAPYVAALRSRAREGRIESTVRFTGFVTEEEKARILGAARVFISGSREEGWGISVAEALAMGVPAVTYDLPVFREVFSRGRIGVPLGDVAALAEATILLLENDKLHSTLSREGRELASALSWDAVARREEEAIAAAAKGNER